MIQATTFRMITFMSVAFISKNMQSYKNIKAILSQFLKFL